MLRWAVAVRVLLLPLVGVSTLPLVVTGCEEPAEGEGEGEGEEKPAAVGGVSFSNTIFEKDHTVGTTGCPQGLGTFTLENTSGEERVVNFTPDGAAIDLLDDDENLLTFVSLPVDGSFEVTVQFNCSITSSFTRRITEAVTDATGTEALGEVKLTAKLNISE